MLGQFSDKLINCVVNLTEFEAHEEVSVVCFIAIMETAVEILPFLYPLLNSISFKITSYSCLTVTALNNRKFCHLGQLLRTWLGIHDHPDKSYKQYLSICILTGNVQQCSF
jgi:hypothetical protein